MSTNESVKILSKVIETLAPLYVDSFDNEHGPVGMGNFPPHAEPVINQNDQIKRILLASAEFYKINLND